MLSYLQLQITKKNAQVFLLLAISALVYLPNGLRLTYFQDDWYYIYDGMIAGAGVFRPMFAIDRPARGIFYQIYFLLFGANALPYHLGEFLWRVVAMLGVYWLVKMLWRENKLAFFVSLLLGLYPGYFWWISAVDYQPHIASLALEVISIAFTVKALQVTRYELRAAYALGSILTGWAYIALVDYAIGMEVLRVTCVYLVVTREVSLSFIKKVFISFRAWLAYALIPLGYFFWRTFLFENQRKATDIEFQLGALLKEPSVILPRWLHLLYESVMLTGLTAWFKQFQRHFFLLDKADMLAGFVVAAAVLILLALAEKISGGEDSALPNRPAVEISALGIIGLALGLVPVIAANRYVNLEDYAHYGLPASLAGAFLLGGLIYALGNRYLRFAFFAAAILLASLTHFAVSKRVLNLQENVEKFWWQVSWRVPALYPDASLVTAYPHKSLLGDEEFALLEPVNVIYFPEPRAGLPVRYPVSALNPTDKDAEYIATGHAQKAGGHRTHKTYFIYQNILLVTQPNPAACVRVIDGKKYLPSGFDTENVKRIAPFSNIEIIRSGADPRVPQAFAFGAEPRHEWCYYFEQADFAVQLQNWDEAARLGDEALGLGYSPADPVEWFPFLQAYVMTGNEDTMSRVADAMNANSFLRKQACALSATGAFDVKIKENLSELFCQ